MRLARAQRLTGRATELGRAEARSAVRGRGVPGGSHVRPTRTTETGSRDERPHTGTTSLQTCLVFSAPRLRPSKSPGIHRKNSGLRPSDPGVRSSAGLGGGGGSLERTCLVRRQANKRRILDGSLLCPASNSLTGSGGVSWRAASVPPHRRISCYPRASRIPGSSRIIPEYPGLKLGSCLASRHRGGGSTILPQPLAIHVLNSERTRLWLRPPPTTGAALSTGHPFTRAELPRELQAALSIVLRQLPIEQGP